MEINVGKNILIKRGKRPKNLSKYESNFKISNSIPYPKQSDICNDSIYLYKCKTYFKTNLGFNFQPALRGDLLISSSCDIGNVVILDFDIAFIDDKFFNLKISKNILKNYVKYWLIKNKKDISKLGYGTTIKVLYIKPFQKYLNNQFIPSINTQQKIINIIEPFEKLKIKLNNKIDKLKFILNNFEDDIDNKFIFLNKNNICTGKRNADFASENGEYRFFTCSINKKQYCNSYKFDDEVILLSGNGDVGEIQYYKGKFDAYQRTYIIQHELIGNIYYSLLKNKKMFLKKSNGSVVKFLTLSTILSIKISNNRLKNKIRYEIIKLIFYYDLIIESISKIINNLIEIYV